MFKNKKEIEEKVIKVLADKLNIPKENIHPDFSLAGNLGVDSFTAVEISYDIEEQYGIEIQDEDLRKFVKVQDIVDYLDNKLNKDNNTK